MKFVLSPTDLTEEFSLVLFNEWRVSTEDDVDDNTKRPHVRFGIVGDPLEDFRRNIARSTTLGSEGVGGKTLLGKSKIGNFDKRVIILGEKDLRVYESSRIWLPLYNHVVLSRVGFS